MGDTVDVHVAAFRKPPTHLQKGLQAPRLFLLLAIILHEPFRLEEGVLDACNLVLRGAQGSPAADDVAVNVPPRINNSRPKP